MAADWSPAVLKEIEEDNVLWRARQMAQKAAESQGSAASDAAPAKRRRTQAQSADDYDFV